MLHINRRSDTQSMPVLRQEEASGFGGSRKQNILFSSKRSRNHQSKPDVGGTGCLGRNPCSSADNVLSHPKLQLWLEMNGLDMHSAYV